MSPPVPACSPHLACEPTDLTLVSLRSAARRFFEVYAHGAQGRPHARPLLDAALDPWFDAITELHRRHGMTPARARAHAHQGIAVTRGLLLDLIATGDRRDVDRAMKLQIEMYEQDLERHGVTPAVDGVRGARGGAQRSRGSGRRR
jgi:hypothetical protein